MFNPASQILQSVPLELWKECILPHLDPRSIQAWSETAKWCRQTVPQNASLAFNRYSEAIRDIVCNNESELFKITNTKKLKKTIFSEIESTQGEKLKTKKGQEIDKISQLFFKALIKACEKGDVVSCVKLKWQYLITDIFEKRFPIYLGGRKSSAEPIINQFKQLVLGHGPNRPREGDLGDLWDQISDLLEYSCLVVSRVSKTFHQFSDAYLTDLSSYDRALEFQADPSHQLPRLRHVTEVRAGGFSDHERVWMHLMRASQPFFDPRAPLHSRSDFAEQLNLLSDKETPVPAQANDPQRAHSNAQIERECLIPRLPYWRIREGKTARPEDTRRNQFLRSVQVRCLVGIPPAPALIQKAIDLNECETLHLLLCADRLARSNQQGMLSPQKQKQSESALSWIWVAAVQQGRLQLLQSLITASLAPPPFNPSLILHVLVQNTQRLRNGDAPFSQEEWSQMVTYLLDRGAQCTPAVHAWILADQQNVASSYCSQRLAQKILSIPPGPLRFKEPDFLALACSQDRSLVSLAAEQMPPLSPNTLLQAVLQFLPHPHGHTLLEALLDQPQQAGLIIPAQILETCVQHYASKEFMAVLLKQNHVLPSKEFFEGLADGYRLFQPALHLLLKKFLKAYPANNPLPIFSADFIVRIIESGKWVLWHRLKDHDLFESVLSLITDNAAIDLQPAWIDRLSRACSNLPYSESALQNLIKKIVFEHGVIDNKLLLFFKEEDLTNAIRAYNNPRISERILIALASMRMWSKLANLSGYISNQHYQNAIFDLIPKSIQPESKYYADQQVFVRRLFKKKLDIHSPHPPSEEDIDSLERWAAHLVRDAELNNLNGCMEVYQEIGNILLSLTEGNHISLQRAREIAILVLQRPLRSACFNADSRIFLEMLKGLFQTTLLSMQDRCNCLERFVPYLKHHSLDNWNFGTYMRLIEFIDPAAPVLLSLIDSTVLEVQKDLDEFLMKMYLGILQNKGIALNDQAIATLLSYFPGITELLLRRQDPPMPLEAIFDPDDFFLDPL